MWRRLLTYLALAATAAAGSPVVAQLSEQHQKAFVAALTACPPIAEAAQRVRQGDVPKETLLAIYSILRNTREVEIHRMRGKSENAVYLAPDGKQEAVFDAGGKQVRDGFNDASYNYFPEKEDPLRHFTFDIAPWLLLGSSPTDPTSRRERVHAYSADIYAGVARAQGSELTEAELAAVDFDQMGVAEAFGVFVAAIERGEAQQMIDTVQSKEAVSPKVLVAIVSRFEKGLQELVLAAPNFNRGQLPKRESE